MLYNCKHQVPTVPKTINTCVEASVADQDLGPEPVDPKSPDEQHGINRPDTELVAAAPLPSFPTWSRSNLFGSSSSGGGAAGSGGGSEDGSAGGGGRFW